MAVKEKFIRDLINELNDENQRLERQNKQKLDICYIVSVIEQRIEECKEFMNTISKYNYCINGYEEDYTGGYTDGKIRILIEKPDKEKESDYLIDAYYDYCYYIEFTYDERYWGYCQCTPEDEGYNAEHNCCGYSCDWVAPAFRITKEYNLGYYSWKGFKRDYWEYEKKFKIMNSENAEELERLEKEKIKKQLEEQIIMLQKRIESLQ